MSDNRPAFYAEDLAYIHDVGYSGSINGAAPGLLEILRKAGVEDRLVVDLGCGPGVWPQQLAEAGYSVNAVDISAANIEIARRRAPTAEFHVGSLWNYRFPRCRAVTALGEVVCYLGKAAASQRLESGTLFRKVYRALQPGGLFVFDVAEVGLDRRRKQAFAQGEDWACLVQFAYDDARDRLSRSITAFRQVGASFRRSRERHVLQLYQARDVARSLRETGFRVRTTRKYGSHPLLPKRVGFIARKP